MEFVLVPRGSFWMGCTDGKPADKQVQIPHELYLGVSPVTQGQWQAVMGSNPSYFSRSGGGKDKVKKIAAAELNQFPVESVSWEDVQQLIGTLQEQEPAPRGWVYRLPREEEWEYACRGGARSQAECAFDFYLDRPSNDLSSTQANFNGNHPGGGAARGPNLERTTKVGSYPPNRLGFYDLHGNVWEWTHSVVDSHTFEGSDRVFRGGCWYHFGPLCQAALRHRNAPPDLGFYDRAPTLRDYFLGFRLARAPVR
jgi:formylglycine-generating enzyme required for sulfatase activity